MLKRERRDEDEGGGERARRERELIKLELRGCSTLVQAPGSNDLANLLIPYYSCCWYKRNRCDRLRDYLPTLLRPRRSAQRDILYYCNHLEILPPSSSCRYRRDLPQRRALAPNPHQLVGLEILARTSTSVHQRVAPSPRRNVAKQRCVGDGGRVGGWSESLAGERSDLLEAEDRAGCWRGDRAP